MYIPTLELNISCWNFVFAAVSHFNFRFLFQPVSKSMVEAISKCIIKGIYSSNNFVIHMLYVTIFRVYVRAYILLYVRILYTSFSERKSSRAQPCVGSFVGLVQSTVRRNS